MSYATQLLARGEEIVFESRPHWFSIVGRTWLWLIAAVFFLAVLIYIAPPPAVDTWDAPAEIIALAVLIGSVARVGWVIWAWRNTQFLVTTRRIIEADGIFNKHMADSALEKINDAHLSQSWLGRIFNFGDLDILTAADEAGINDFPMLADPVQFKVAMLNQKDQLEHPDLAAPAYQRRGEQPPMEPAEPMAPRAGSDRVTVVPAPDPEPVAPPPAVAAPPSAIDETAATLTRLATLRDSGLITTDEYEAKKRELLGRI
jgi:hypothetical protein